MKTAPGGFDSRETWVYAIALALSIGALLLVLRYSPRTTTAVRHTFNTAGWVYPGRRQPRV